MVPSGDFTESPTPDFQVCKLGEQKAITENPAF